MKEYLINNLMNDAEERKKKKRREGRESVFVLLNVTSFHIIIIAPAVNSRSCMMAGEESVTLRYVLITMLVISQLNDKLLDYTEFVPLSFKISGLGLSKYTRRL
jgi:hypothetical protein